MLEILGEGRNAIQTASNVCRKYLSGRLCVESPSSLWLPVVASHLQAPAHPLRPDLCTPPVSIPPPYSCSASSPWEFQMADSVNSSQQLLPKLILAEQKVVYAAHPPPPLSLEGGHTRSFQKFYSLLCAPGRMRAFTCLCVGVCVYIYICSIVFVGVCV